MGQCTLFSKTGGTITPATKIYPVGLGSTLETSWTGYSTVTDSSGVLTVSLTCRTDSQGNRIVWGAQVDLTDKKTVTLTYSSTDMFSYGNALTSSGLCISNNSAYPNPDALTTKVYFGSDDENKTITYDVSSLSGNYYVYFVIANQSKYQTQNTPNILKVTSFTVR